MSWSKYIKDDLEARIGSGRELPARMTLYALSKRYGVSLTPVRIAVNELIAEGFIEKGENGRLRVVPEKIGRAHGGPVVQPKRPRDYYEEISKNLLTQSMCGEAVFVREEDTAKRYSVSQSAVRQVLHRLAGMGLLEHLPRRGWRLRPFRREDLDAFLEVREVLELKALALAWPRLVDAELQAIYDRNVPGTGDTPPAIDNSLHNYLIEKSNNRYIREFVERYGAYYEMLFQWDATDRESATTTVEQHRAIIGAILRRDRRTANKQLVEHIRYNYGLLKTAPGPGIGLGRPAPPSANLPRTAP
jgi:DNA-binding GntR family transcriptional regulator